MFFFVRVLVFELSFVIDEGSYFMGVLVIGSNLEM